MQIVILGELVGKISLCEDLHELLKKLVARGCDRYDKSIARYEPPVLARTFRKGLLDMEDGLSLAANSKSKFDQLYILMWLHKYPFSG
jgi:hypothetical protein